MIVFQPPFGLLGKGKPVIFLAGPIQGAPDWHSEAIRYFEPYEIMVASPKRENWVGAGYAEQVDWETKYLLHAAQTGAIMFWLAKEQTHHPERAYAQTTRFELAEWLFRDDQAVVIGIEPGFSGERYIRHRLKAYEIEPYATLEKTCDAAILRVETRDRCETCGQLPLIDPCFCSNSFHAVSSLSYRGFR